MFDSVLRLCADSKKRGLSMLPNVGHQIVRVKIAGNTGTHHILYVSRLRVNFIDACFRKLEQNSCMV